MYVYQLNRRDRIDAILVFECINNAEGFGSPRTHEITPVYVPIHENLQLRCYYTLLRFNEAGSPSTQKLQNGPLRDFRLPDTLQ